jgi:hypothetical protein
MNVEAVRKSQGTIKMRQNFSKIVKVSKTEIKQQHKWSVFASEWSSSEAHIHRSRPRNLQAACRDCRHHGDETLAWAAELSMDHVSPF